MNMISYFRYAICLLFFAGASMEKAQADDFQALTDSIAETLGYPANRLVITDETQSPKAKAKGGVLAGIVIRAKDGTFATITVGVTKRGLILNSELEAHCEKAAQDQASDRANKITKIAFGGDVYGYTGLGLFGPGGSSERIVATSPSRDIDLQLAMITPREGLASDSASKQYHDLVTNGGAPLIAKLVAAVRHVVNYVEQTNLRSSSGNGAKVPTGTLQSRSPSPGATQSPLVPSANPAATVERSSPIWPWVVGILVLIVIVTVVLKRRS